MNKDLKIYAIKDELAGIFGAPFLAPNDAVAQRQFQEQYKESYMKADLQLYALGEYDSDTGEISPKLKFIANYIMEAK